MTSVELRKENNKVRERLDHWAIFVRQQGDEGWCSRDLHRLGLGELVKLRLPQTGALKVEVDDRTKFTARDGSQAWWSISDEVATGSGTLEAGASLTFRLPPDPTDVIRGDLWLKWQGDNLPPRPNFNSPEEGVCTPKPPKKPDDPKSREAEMAAKFSSTGDRDNYDAALAVSVEGDEQAVPRRAASVDVSPLVLSAPTYWRGATGISWSQRQELKKRSDALKSNAPYILE